MRSKALVMLLLFFMTNNLIHNDFLGEYTLSLKDIRENPEKYLGERAANFTLLNVTLRPDPSNRLIETYYLVYIQDSFQHSMPFVISEQQYQMYEKHIGKNATLYLIGKIGPELIHPPDKLRTNILVSKARDPYYREMVYIYIFLEEEIEIWLNKPPEASFTFSPASPKARKEVQFTDTSTDQDGQIDSWYWEFGDSATSNEKNPIHKYSAKGTYTAILTVTDNQGAEANSTLTITVKPAPIIPGLPLGLEGSTILVVLGIVAIVSLVVIIVRERKA